MELDIEEVSNFLQEDEKGIKLLNSLSDKRVTQAIKTYQEKHEAQELGKLQQEIAKLQEDAQRKSFEDIAKSAGIPDNLIGLVVGKTQEETRQRAEAFLSSLNNEVELAKLNTTKELLKGKDPQSQDTGSIQKPLQEMTSAEIIANLDKLQEIK